MWLYRNLRIVDRGVPDADTQPENRLETVFSALAGDLQLFMMREKCYPCEPMRSVPLRSPHTPVRQSSNSFSPIWSRLIALALSYGLVGWVLSAYTVSKLVWLGTLAATFYLAWVGPGAIVLSSFWVVGIVAIASPQHPWFTRLPAPSFQIIPFVLLVNCLFALGLIGLLANTYDCLRQSRFRRNLTFYTLLFPALLGLITGGFIYHMFTVPSI